MPRQARSRATVEAVLDATAQLLVDHGYRKLTTTRVAERAGVSVGSLYQYFPTKEALVKALADRKMSQVLAAIQRAVAESEGQSFAERVRALLAGLMAVKARQAALGAAIATTMAEIEGDTYVRQVTLTAVGIVKQLLEDHPDEVEVGDTHLTAYVVAHAVEGVVSGLVADPPRPLNDPVLLETLTDLVLGYVARQGP